MCQTQSKRVAKMLTSSQPEHRLNTISLTCTQNDVPITMFRSPEDMLTKSYIKLSLQSQTDSLNSGVPQCMWMHSQYTGVPQFIGMHSHILRYSIMEECIPKCRATRIYWNASLYTGFTSIRGMYAHVLGCPNVFGMQPRILRYPTIYGLHSNILRTLNARIQTKGIV